MKLLNGFKKRISNLKNEDFEGLAVEIFQFQVSNNPIYGNYVANLGVKTISNLTFDEIPFLPIEFFKNHEVKTGSWTSEAVFMSSGTTKTGRSCHYVNDLDYYDAHSLSIFSSFYGEIASSVIFALLPSYQQQENSSLIRMVDHLMTKSDSKLGGYFLDDFDGLYNELKKALSENKKVVLFGVGYALLDFCERAKEDLDGLTIIETGGMKGRREELTKQEFYDIMSAKLGDISIHSEYGMTELMSQAYSFGDMKYQLPNQMRVKIRDVNDPFCSLGYGLAGGINIIDLANIHSCSFVETKDLGKLNNDDTFEILGRIDNSDIRGCNLLIL